MPVIGGKYGNLRAIADSRIGGGVDPFLDMYFLPFCRINNYYTYMYICTHMYKIVFNDSTDF